ncbi:MAG: hypothetical protein GYA24_02120 [Candidatus Lokiarchaeota archaeon]|nr:hypothetical protein [Candidatus Lokiarchaeota archaeon]
MANQSLFLLKVLWITFMAFWLVVFAAVLLDPSITTTSTAFGLDPYASTIFAASLGILVYMEVKLALRYKARKSTIVAILWFTFLAFSFTIGFSLVAELYVAAPFIPIVNNFLNRTIFVFTLLGFFNLVFFIIEVFEGGLHYPYVPASQARPEFVRVWITVLSSFGLICIFMYYLVRSIWVDLDATELIIQTLPVLVIALVDMFALLVQPFKLIHRVPDAHEKAGFIALFLAGISFVCFIVFFIVHTVSVSGHPYYEQYHMRGIMYYLAMSFVVFVCILFYLGIVYPMKKKEHASA